MTEKEKSSTSFSIESLLSTNDSNLKKSPKQSVLRERTYRVARSQSDDEPTDSVDNETDTNKNGTESSGKRLQDNQTYVTITKSGNSVSDKQNLNVKITPDIKEEPGCSKTRKKTRTVFSRHQIFYLESAFEAKRYLSSTERSEIASTLSLTETQVKVWFQNRRNKWKSQITGDPSFPLERFPMLPFGGRFPHPIGTFGSPLYPPLFYL